MGNSITSVVYTCDWLDEHDAVCGESESFSGVKHNEAAREAGWGWYANATIRWDRYTTGAKLWFCPVHATVFRNNHGWGSLEDYGPPIKSNWWSELFKVKS